MEERCGHVIVLFPAPRETLHSSENTAQEFYRRVGTAIGAQLLQTLQPELLSVAVERVHQPIRAKENGVARLQADCHGLVPRFREQTRWNSGKLQQPAVISRNVKGTRNASAGDLHDMGIRIKNRVLHGRVPARKTANHKPAVQGCEDFAWRDSRLVDAS